MYHSPRFINFAASTVFVAALLLISSCQGRRASDMVPDGDTIEVVIGSNATDTVASPEPDSANYIQTINN